MHYFDGKGRYNDEYEKLWNQLVPESGQTDTVQGELVRIIGRLTDEYYRNGNSNWDRNYRLFTNFLYKNLSDYKVFSIYEVREIREDIQTIRNLGSGKENSYDIFEDEDAFDRITNRIVEWCRQKPDLLKRDSNFNLKR